MLSVHNRYCSADGRKSNKICCSLLTVPELFMMNVKASRKRIPRGLLLLIGGSGALTNNSATKHDCITITNTFHLKLVEKTNRFRGQFYQISRYAQMKVSISLRSRRKSAIKKRIDFTTLCNIYTTTILPSNQSLRSREIDLPSRLSQ